ncbi:multimerin-2 [Pelobates cultripes]|uniref:Multimerin-2 n=1 Tax=Pelobates cultripes TaxID=61616 RepID=A0AAD1T7X3_PELCU|nr:multimerin-2 [Pelobates cultripes]
MEGKLCSIIFCLGMVNAVTSLVNRPAYDGSLSVGSRLEVHGSSLYNHGLPGYDRHQEKREHLDQSFSDTPKTTATDTVDRNSPGAEHPDPRRGNWCSFVRSRVVSYVELCKTEKYVIRSQMPCPSRTSDCQKTMYRLAQKPVYEVKRKAVTSLEWRCCDGYIGDHCEDKDPNAIQVPEELLAKVEKELEPAMSTDASEIMKDLQSQEHLLVSVQNDIHQASGSLLEFQSVMENNVTLTNDSESQLAGVEDRHLRDVLLPHVENFLREHFNPMWVSFNKSLQNLSSIVKNLSENVESNRKRLDRFLENSIPQNDLRELGSKFESKIQENIVKLEQMRHEMDNQFHVVQAGIHYNLTVIKTETDMKFKRNHKLQQSQFSQVNLSISELRRDQEQFQDDLQDITQNITELWESCTPKERETTPETSHHVNETLAEHNRQIKDLYTESDAAFENISTLEKWFKELRTDFKKNSDEVRVSFIEKSLILEENKDFILRQLMELNYTIVGIQESSDELFRNCDCQKMSLDILSLEEVQRNFSNLYKDILYGIEDVKQKEGSSKTSLENSFEDLSQALQMNRLSLTAQQEQGRSLMNLTSHLQSQANNFSNDVAILKKNNNQILDHIKLLDSSFNSLLEDATRHDRALEALLGDELLEEFSEETPYLLQMTMLQIYELLNETQFRLENQQQTTKSLIDRVHFLENQSQKKDYPDPNTIFNIEHHIEGVTNDSPFKQNTMNRMETNHDASSEYEATNSDITTLKDDIEHLSIKIKRLESYLPDGNDTVINTLKPLNNSIGTMKLEIVSLRELFSKHTETFHKLFGNHEALIASNTPLDLTKVHSLLDKKVKKKSRGGELKHKKNDELQSDASGELPPRQDSSVAFAASFTEGADAVRLIQFNSILLNYGNAFNPDDYEFSAPYKGVYAFSISVDFSPGRALGHLVFRGQETIILQNISSKEGDGLKHSFAVVELDKDDKVWFMLLQGSIKKNSSGTILAGYLIFKT